MLGILLIAKPQGLTSHDVVANVRRRLRTKRVGHAGTLDPQATGLLVVAVGAATRFLQYLPLEPKKYTAEFTFGVATTTFDGEGVVTKEGPVPQDLPARVLAELPKFQGLIEQLPPMYSAVKKDGKPLYHYARQGEEVERQTRRVHIETFAPLGYDGPIGRFEVVCSGGTYVRTLANDLGEAIGCGAYLSALVRDAVGRFRLEDAIALDDVAEDRLMPLSEALPPMPLVQLALRETHEIRNGQSLISGDRFTAKHVALVDPAGAVFGIASVVEGNVLQPECVIPR